MSTYKSTMVQLHKQRVKGNTEGAIKVSKWLMFTLIGLVFSSGFIASCKSSSKPEGLLSKDEMAKVMTEFYLKEARINTWHIDQDSGAKVMQYFRGTYALESGIADSLVEISYQYYLANPKELSEIYDRIIDTLALREQRTNVRPGGPQRIQ